MGCNDGSFFCANLQRGGECAIIFIYKEGKMVKKYRKLLGYIGPFRKRRFWLVVLCAASILIGSIMPFFIGKLVNMVTVSAPIADILKFGALLIIIGLLDATLNSTQNYIWHMYSTEYLNYFRTIMLQAALKKNVKFFKENDEDFTNRILHDTSILSYDISIGFPMFILNVLRIGIVVVLMFYMSPILTILPLLIVPIYTFTFHRIDKKIRTASNKERQLFTRVSETVKEYLNGVLQIKINGKEKFFLDNFKNTINEYTNSAKDIKKYTAISYGVGGFTKALLPIVVLISGAILIIKGQLTLGYLFAFYSYLDFLYEPMTNLSDWYTGINVSLGMSDRVLSFLEDDMEEETGEKIRGINSIEFKNVSFSYDSQKPVLNSVNFKFEKGDIVGIIGPSGSGKSTIIDIILKIWDTYTGEVIVNDTELRKINRSSYYDNLSLVEQEPFIFRDTILRNIQFDNEVVAENVLSESELSNLVEKKDGKLNHELTTNGANLSGGEKQRIALARALYSDKDLIILDEFTSALDNETEDKIVQNIKKLGEEGKIVIIITHRKSPLSITNKIIDLEKF